MQELALALLVDGGTKLDNATCNICNVIQNSARDIQIKLHNYTSHWILAEWEHPTVVLPRKRSAKKVKNLNS